MIDNPPTKKNQLLNDLRSKKISLVEFLTECAYWYLDCFETIHKKPYPSMPVEYQEYLQANFQEKKKLMQEGFFFAPKIKNYLDAKETIKHENEAVLFHLKDHLSHIPEGDFLARSRFQEKITDFEAQDFG